MTDAQGASPGRYFLHAVWRWSDGAPRLCRVAAVRGATVTFAVVGRMGFPLRGQRSIAAEEFVRDHLGGWVTMPAHGRPDDGARPA